MLIDKLVKYVHDTLGITVSVRKWEQDAFLPYFLQDNYDYHLARINGLEVLLMIEVGDEGHSPGTVHKHMEQVGKTWGGKIVYVREQISSFERKRLIEAGIPFIIPGNQLFMPMLALDLREYFRRPKQKNIHRFSPATQALALYWIYNSPVSVLESRKTPTEMAGILGYSKMTLSRAFKEIDAALAEINPVEAPGNLQYYDLPGYEFWQQLQPYLHSPVKRRCYLLRLDLEENLGLRAGLTALAAYSMLAEPSQEVYALGQSEWKVLQHNRQNLILDRPDAEALVVEIWGYQPSVFSAYGKDGAVDPLSLYLSLKGSSDERIEKALEELLQGIQW